MSTETTAAPKASRLRTALHVARRLLAPAILAAALFLVLWLRFLAPMGARAARVTRGDVVQEAFGRGTVESQREAAVGFDLAGRLSDVLVEEGARVTLGQELARLETNQADADLRFAKTGLAAARASLQRLAAEEERTRALLDAAEREQRRIQSLFDAGAVPAKERDETADKLRVARADLDRLLAQRAEATRGIDVAASGAEQRQVAVVRATLLAPFDGVVTRRLREPGDTVTIGSTVLRIVDAGHVYVRASLDEAVLPNLTEDQRGVIVFPGTEAAVDAKVTRIPWEADRQTHEILVEVTPTKLERRVAIGQRADVRIELARRDALRIPISMIHADDAGPYVFVDRGGRIATARPRFGLSGREHVEVLEGLADGDVLLASPKPGATLAAGRRWRAE